MSAFSLELQGLTKQFGKTEIIRGVDLQVTAVQQKSSNTLVTESISLSTSPQNQGL